MPLCSDSSSAATATTSNDCTRRAGAALTFSVTIAVAQQASHLYGELQTVALSRWVSLLACVALFLVRRQAPRVPLRWWPWIGLQGLLDGGAYVALLAGSQGPGAEIAVVVGSGFGAVTVLLARVVLREAMTWAQWAGIAAIVAGVAVKVTGQAAQATAVRLVDGQRVLEVVQAGHVHEEHLEGDARRQAHRRVA